MYKLLAYRPGPNFIFIADESLWNIYDESDKLGPEWLVSDVVRPGLVERKSPLVHALEVDVAAGYVESGKDLKVVSDRSMAAKLVGVPGEPSVIGGAQNVAIILNRIGGSYLNTKKVRGLGDHGPSLFNVVFEPSEDEFAMFEAQDTAGVWIKDGEVVRSFDRMTSLEGFRGLFGGSEELHRRLSEWEAVRLG